MRELDLIFESLRTQRQADSLEPTLLAGPLDWAVVLDLARRHGVIPLLTRCLKAWPAEWIPESVRQQLDSEARANAQEVLALTGELLRLVQVLDTHGIAAIPYKGPVLSALLYGDLAGRAAGDLDLLVRPCDFARARALLLAHGYRPWRSLTPAQRAATRRSQCHDQLVREDGQLLVELHWAVAPRYLACPVDLEGVWGRTKRFPLGETQVLVMAPEDLLLLLCVHGGKHLWERLMWLCDVAQLLRKTPSLETDRLRRAAIHAGAARLLKLGLSLAHDLLRAPVPHELVEWIDSDPTVVQLADRIRRRLVGTPSPHGFWHEGPFHVRMRECLSDQLRYVFHGGLIALTPTAKEWDLIPLSDRWFPLYYLIRPIRLMAQYGRRWLAPSPS